MKTRVIINPTAGAKRARERLSKHRSKLERAFGDIEWRESLNAEHVTTLAHEAAIRGYERVLVAGGDGTVHYAVNGLAGTQTALGIIPVGTGNDVAAAVGIPKNLDAAINTLIGNHVRAIDLGEVRSVPSSKGPPQKRIFCCVLGVGMDTPALKRINAAKILRRGRLLYSLAALKTILNYKAQPMRIHFNDQIIESKVFFAAVTNTQSYAGGMKICPQAKVNDGLLDLCIIPPMPLFQLLRSFTQVFNGQHVKRPEITLAQSAKTRFDSDSPIPITLDGELTNIQTPIEIRALPASLRVLGAPVTTTLTRNLAHALKN
ncbi:MAG: diacylglycerol kinase family lipid kinase [Planctomycetota bacterium]|nr:diacylglycerol kinase family lipid kinase [Planctomycetota bacterium]